MYHQYTQYEWRTIAQMKRDNEKSKKKTTKEDVYEVINGSEEPNLTNF